MMAARAKAGAVRSRRSAGRGRARVLALAVSCMGLHPAEFAVVAVSGGPVDQHDRGEHRRQPAA